MYNPSSSFCVICINFEMGEPWRIFQYMKHCPYIEGESYELFLTELNINQSKLNGLHIVEMIFVGIDRHGRMQWKTDINGVTYFMKPFARFR